MLAWFRAQKDALFAGHPQSPLTCCPAPHLCGPALLSLRSRLRVAAHLTPLPMVEEPSAAAAAHGMPLRPAARLNSPAMGTHWPWWSTGLMSTAAASSCRSAMRPAAARATAAGATCSTR